MSAKNHLIEVLNALALGGYEPEGWAATAIKRAQKYLQEELCHEERPTKGGPTENDPDRPYCKPDQSCCDFCCGN